MFYKIFSFVYNLIIKINEDELYGRSAQFSYYIILGIFPIIMLSISILSGYSYYINYLLESLSKILPENVYEIINDLVNKSQFIGMNTFLTYFVTLWTATAGSGTIIDGIHKAYNIEIEGSFVLMRLKGVLFCTAIIMILQLVFGLIVLGGHFVVYLQNNTDFTTNYLYINFIRYMIPILLLFITFSLAYKFLPHQKVKFLYVLPGSIFSTVGFIFGSVGYSFYIGTKLKYFNSIYGNLSGIFEFMIWVFILSFIFLLGAEINFLFNKSKSKT